MTTQKANLPRLLVALKGWRAPSQGDLDVRRIVQDRQHGTAVASDVLGAASYRLRPPQNNFLDSLTRGNERLVNGNEQDKHMQVRLRPTGRLYRRRIS